MRISKVFTRDWTKSARGQRMPKRSRKRRRERRAKTIRK